MHGHHNVVLQFLSMDCCQIDNSKKKTKEHDGLLSVQKMSNMSKRKINSD